MKLAMSHVVPDLVQKVLKGQDPLHILGAGNQVRHYTYGGDLAKGIRICIEHPAALNQDFNLSTPTRTTVLELAELIWRKVHGDSKPFRYVSDPPFEYDVQERSPDVQQGEKAARIRSSHQLERNPRRSDSLGGGADRGWPNLVGTPAIRSDDQLTLVIPVFSSLSSRASGASRGICFSL